MYTIIGCGNANRSDDAVGVHIAQTLRVRLAHQAAHVRVFDAGTAGMEVMFQARGASTLVIVDACRSGHLPGSIFRVPGAELEQTYSPSLNLHDFRWNHALTAGRKIFREDFPKTVTVFLIEAGSLELGCELTESVKHAAHRVVEDILQDVGQHTQQAYQQPDPSYDQQQSHQHEKVSLAGSAQPNVNPAKQAEALTMQAGLDLKNLSIRNGHLHCPATVHRYYLHGIGSVALLPQQQDLLVLPLMGSSVGGVLVKQRNSEGDCTIALDEILQRHTLCPSLRGPATAKLLGVRWDTERAALVLPQLFEVSELTSGLPKKMGKNYAAGEVDTIYR